MAEPADGLMAALPTPDSSVSPPEIRTERLLLRPYRGTDAERLHPILAANVEHLKTWIPKHVWEPVPVAVLQERLSGYAFAFETNVEWRYAAMSLDDSDVVGSVGLFPRDATARVPMAKADRVEIGYWIRQELCGMGYATEVTRAMVGVARRLAGVRSIEIRCNATNAASAAVPRRLAFQLDAEAPDGAQVWSLALP